MQRLVIACFAVLWSSAGLAADQYAVWVVGWRAPQAVLSNGFLGEIVAVKGPLSPRACRAALQWAVDHPLPIPKGEFTEFHGYVCSSEDQWHTMEVAFSAGCRLGTADSANGIKAWLYRCDSPQELLGTPLPNNPR